MNLFFYYGDSELIRTATLTYILKEDPIGDIRREVVALMGCPGEESESLEITHQWHSAKGVPDIKIWGQKFRAFVEAKMHGHFSIPQLRKYARLLLSRENLELDEFLLAGMQGKRSLRGKPVRRWQIKKGSKVIGIGVSIGKEFFWIVKNGWGKCNLYPSDATVYEIPRLGEVKLFLTTPSFLTTMYYERLDPVIRALVTIGNENHRDEVTKIFEMDGIFRWFRKKSHSGGPRVVFIEWGELASVIERTAAIYPSPYRDIALMYAEYIRR